MNILLVGNSYPSSREPTAGIFVHEERHALMRAGHDVKVLVLARQGVERRDFLRARQRFRNARLHGNELVALARDDAKMDLVSYWSLCKPFVFREELFVPEWEPDAADQFDIVLVHSMLHAGLAVRWLRRRYPNARLVLREHDDLTLQSFSVRSIVGRRLADFDELWANSAGSLRQLDALLRVPAGRTSPEARIVRPRMKMHVDQSSSEGGSLSLLTVGTLTEAKGHLEAFELVHSLVKGQKDWSWTLIGAGPLQQRLERLIAFHGWQRNVRILSPMPRPALAPYYRNTMLYLQLSRRETFGMAPLEAFCAGARVVVSPAVTSFAEFGLFSEPGVYMLNPGDSVLAAREILSMVHEPIPLERMEKSRQLVAAMERHGAEALQRCASS